MRLRNKTQRERLHLHSGPIVRSNRERSSSGPSSHPPVASLNGRFSRTFASASAANSASATATPASPCTPWPSSVAAHSSFQSRAKQAGMPSGLTVGKRGVLVVPFPVLVRPEHEVVRRIAQPHQPRQRPFVDLMMMLFDSTEGQIKSEKRHRLTSTLVQLCVRFCSWRWPFGCQVLATPTGSVKPTAVVRPKSRA